MKKKLKLIFMFVLLFMVFIVCCSPHIEPERMVVKEITVATDMDIMEIEKKCDIIEKDKTLRRHKGEQHEIFNR